MHTIPGFLTIVFALSIFAACSDNKAQESDTESMNHTAQSLELLVGTYTGKGSQGIYLLEFDPQTGTLENKRLVAETQSPSYLSRSKDRNFVYAVNEGKAGNVSAFSWNSDRSKLIQHSQQPSEGDYPCFIELNDTENLLAVANYGTGNILVYKLDDKGAIEDSPVLYQHTGKGPHLPNQASAHAHCVKFDPNGKYLYAIDLGIDKIITYPINEDGGVEAASSQVSMDPGDGPRHMIFHPSKDLAFVVNELSGSVTTLKVDHEKGLLEKIAKASTLPQDFDGKNSCADIHITSNGKFLYASNRGDNSIAIFEVLENGELKRLAITSVEGDWPRNFSLSPDENFLLVANQKSNNITVFEIDPDTGLMTYTGHEISISQPVALKF